MAGGEPRFGTRVTYMNSLNHGVARHATEKRLLHAYMDDTKRAFLSPPQGTTLKTIRKFGLDRRGAAELPLAALQGVEHDQLLLAGAVDHRRQLLPGALVDRLARGAHLLVARALLGGGRQLAGRRGRLLPLHHDVVVLGLARLHGGAHLELAEARLVDAGV